MQFTKFFALSALTSLAVATGGGSVPPSPTDSCCGTVTTAADPAAATILKAIGVVLQDLNVLVGITCSPITVIGSGNGACSGGSTRVNCVDNSHALISLGCVLVTV